ncbi:MAG: hypothetical protein HGA96_10790 [Desulfobulbaceae bacterium]|nr:hypothetical protein [Desulfobulbaceae bacterium]
MTIGALVHKNIVDLICVDHPDWSEKSLICPTDLGNYRSRYVHFLLESDKGELTELEREVLARLHDQEIQMELIGESRQGR